MRIKKKCLICGSEYWTGNGKAMYCSDDCRKEATRRRQKKWREEHPEYHKQYFSEHPESKERFKERHPDYARNRWRKIRGSTEYKRNCIVCGQAFATYLPHKVTCSDECRDINIARRRKEDKRKCRTKEQAHEQWIRRRYGSEEERQKYLRERELERERLRAEKSAEREAEKEANRIFGECAVCGNKFTTFNPNQKTCCKECGKKLQYARKQSRIPKDQIVDKDITLEALYRRDSGVCYLCGKICDWNDKNGNVVGMKYPSIDHIVPVSRGGFHSWGNVRLAHFGCNVRKSNDMLPNAKSLVPKNAYSEKKEPVDQRKTTLQLSKDGELIAQYASTAEAERVTGIKQRGIQGCARGESRTYKGYVWEYA